MNNKARTKVAGLIHRRSIGEITRDEFFELLSDVRSDSMPSLSRVSSISGSDPGHGPTTTSMSGFEQLQDPPRPKEAWSSSSVVPQDEAAAIAIRDDAPPLLTTHEANSLVERSRSARAAPAQSGWAVPQSPPPVPSLRGAQGRSSPSRPQAAEELPSTVIQLNSMAMQNVGPVELNRGLLPGKHIMSEMTLGGASPATPGLADASQMPSRLFPAEELVPQAKVPQSRPGPREETTPQPTVAQMHYASQQNSSHMTGYASNQSTPFVTDYGDYDNGSADYASHQNTPHFTDNATGPASILMDSLEEQDIRRHLNESDVCRRSQSQESIATFIHRNNVWQYQKQLRCQEMQKTLASRELQECSFQPQTRKKKIEKKVDVAALTNRLSSSQSRLKSSELARLWRERHDKEIMQECTFAPDLSKSCLSFQHRDLSDTISELDSAGDASVGVCASHGTASSKKRPTQHSPTPSFAPSTNGIASHMINAHAYLRESVFDRLSRQPCADLAASESLDSFGQHDASQACASIPSSVGHNSEAHEAFQETFLGFLQRQNECDEERLTRLKQLEDETNGSHRPELCKRSRTLVASRGRGASSTFDRLSCPKEKPQPAEVEQTAESFQPHINRRSKMLRSRSCTELSVLDQQKREQRAEKRRTDQERKDQKVTPFKPSICKNSATAQSRIRILEEPDSYLDRVEKLREKQTARSNHIRQQQVEKEASECTFKPSIKASPGYIRQMAESYKTRRSLQQKEKENELVASEARKPDWR